MQKAEGSRRRFDNKGSYIYGLIIVLAFTAASFVSNLITGTNYAKPKPVPNTKEVVLYPGAHVTEDRSVTPQLPLLDPSRVVTLETPDSPEVVVTYYKREMINRGWNTDIGPETDPYSPLFTYSTPCGRGCIPDIFMTRVEVTRTETNGSSVKIELIYY